MCEIDTALLQKFEETKKALLKDKQFQRERQANYTREWKNRKKETANADPDFIANKARIEAERLARRTKIADKMAIEKGKREEKKARKKETEENKEKNKEEYNTRIACIENHPFRDTVKTIKFNQREHKGVVNSIAVIVTFTNPDKKTKPLKEVAHAVEGVALEDILKFKLVSIMVAIELMYKEANTTEEEYEPTAEELEDFSDFDFGD